MERAEEEEREKAGSKKRTVRKEEGGVIGGTDKSKEWAEAVDRQVDLLDLLVNGPSTRTHLVQTCAHTHRPAAFSGSDESGEAGNAAQ